LNNSIQSEKASCQFPCSRRVSFTLSVITRSFIRNPRAQGPESEYLLRLSPVLSVEDRITVRVHVPIWICYFGGQEGIQVADGTKVVN
jgi:hypothetical protein